jgi:hypothetical protein
MPWLDPVTMIVFKSFCISVDKIKKDILTDVLYFYIIWWFKCIKTQYFWCNIF